MSSANFFGVKTDNSRFASARRGFSLDSVLLSPLLPQHYSDDASGGPVDVIVVTFVLYSVRFRTL